MFDTNVQKMFFVNFKEFCKENRALDPADFDSESNFRSEYGGSMGLT